MNDRNSIQLNVKDPSFFIQTYEKAIDKYFSKQANAIGESSLDSSIKEDLANNQLYMQMDEEEGKSTDNF